MPPKKRVLMITGYSVFLAVVTGFVLYFCLVLTQPTKNGFVTFDTVKYINARRQMVTQLLGKNDAKKQEAISVLAGVQKTTMPLIKKIADGRLVIVKQALVIDGQVPDITDQVLKKLGLPVNAATVQPQNPSENKLMTPYGTSNAYHRADSSFASRKRESNDLISKMAAKNEADQQKNRRDNIQSVVP